jgi:hypothetical protein
VIFLSDVFAAMNQPLFFFARRHHVLRAMLRDIEEVAVRIRAAGFGAGAAKVCYPFTLLRRELSNHRATLKKFKPIPGWSDGLNDWNVLNCWNPHHAASFLTPCLCSRFSQPQPEFLNP